MQDRDERRALVVARFDRDQEPGGELRSLPVEDACQLLNRYRADKYSVAAEDVVTAVADACSARAVALRDTLFQFVLAWATGNGDLHAKNISVLRRREEWRVAPIYEIPRRESSQTSSR